MHASPSCGRIAFHPSRRGFLRAAGVAVALPILDRFLPRRASAQEAESPRRLVFICTTLGLHGPNFFPAEAGADYQPPPYLEILSDHRQDFTVFSGLSHPDQAGADGHSSERTWLTSAPHPGLGGFRNTVSVDQLAAEKLGYVTRFPSLVLGTSNGSQSYTRSGVMIHALSRPSQVYSDLFLAGSPQEIEREQRKLAEGRSVLDAVSLEAARLAKASSREDRARLEEYFESVREMERRLKAAEDWIERPKPRVDAQPPQDIANEADLIGRMELMFELIPLALATDSTRTIAMTVQGRNDVPPVEGVSIDHHNLSHHGQDDTKITQLELIERAELNAFQKLLAALAAKQEAGRRLLDHTAVLFGSNLGNANSHDWRNLPILLAGGGFRHGRHLVHDKDDNRPLCDLFVSLLQFQRHEVERFGSSKATLDLGS